MFSNGTQKTQHHFPIQSSQQHFSFTGNAMTLHFRAGVRWGGEQQPNNTMMEQEKEKGVLNNSEGWKYHYDLVFPFFLEEMSRDNSKIFPWG
jgi:hypothetical protein